MLNLKEVNKIIREYSLTYGIETYGDVVKFLKKHNIVEQLPGVYADSIDNNLIFRITTIKRGMYELEGLILPLPLSMLGSVSFFDK